MKIHPRTWTPLAGLLVLAVGTNTVSAQAPPAAAGKPPAVVNGEAINQSEVKTMVDMVIKSQFKTQMPTEAQYRAVWTEVVNMAIDDVLLRQLLAHSNVIVPPAEVDKQFTELKTNLEKSGRKLDDFYKESGQTETQIKTSILNMLRWAEFIKTRIKEEDVKHYYDENKEFFDKVTVHASHILLRLSLNASEVEKQAARQKLLALRADIVAGKLDFAEAAKKYSQCSSAPNGGDVGFIPRKMLVEENFAKAAFAMKPGEVSAVVQTEAGLHLIKVLERKAGEPSDYTIIKDDVRECYVEELRQNLILHERREAKIEVTSPW